MRKFQKLEERQNRYARRTRWFQYVLNLLFLFELIWVNLMKLELINYWWVRVCWGGRILGLKLISFGFQLKLIKISTFLLQHLTYIVRPFSQNFALIVQFLRINIGALSSVTAHQVILTQIHCPLSFQQRWLIIGTQNLVMAWSAYRVPAWNYTSGKDRFHRGKHIACGVDVLVPKIRQKIYSLKVYPLIFKRSFLVYGMNWLL